MRGRPSVRLDRMDALAQPTIFPVQQSLSFTGHFLVRPRRRVMLSILPRAWKMVLNTGDECVAMSWPSTARREGRPRRS